MPSSVTERDMGWNRIQANIDALAKRPGVRVGVLANTSASYEAEDEAGPTTVAEVAYWNEFGTATIPERPAIRTTVDNHRVHFELLKSKLMDAMLRGAMVVDTALGLLGVDAQSKMRQNITELSEPPNAPSTIARKGSANPLVDEGIYRGSINWERD